MNLIACYQSITWCSAPVSLSALQTMQTANGVKYCVHTWDIWGTGDYHGYLTSESLCNPPGFVQTDEGLWLSCRILLSLINLYTSQLLPDWACMVLLFFDLLALSRFDFEHNWRVESSLNLESSFKHPPELLWSQKITIDENLEGSVQTKRSVLSIWDPLI